MSERQYERFASMQYMVIYLSHPTPSMLEIFTDDELDNQLELYPITKVFICPDEIVMPYNKAYILIAFDYEPCKDNRAIFKCSERYNVSHFHEKISFN